MTRRLATVIVVLMLLALVVPSASAQEYLFGVPKMDVHVYVNTDGTYSIEYTFVFKPYDGSHVIDYVDVGMPNGNYDFGSISADVNGKPVSISSDYQGDGSYGFAVDMGQYAIQPGRTGNLHVFVPTVRRGIYPDDNDQNYASVVFSPTWFGSAYVRGQTDLSMSIHLPQGVKPDEPRYHLASGSWQGSSEPETGLDSEGRVTYVWRAKNANAHTQYTFGASFPASYIPASAIVRPSLWDQLGISGDDLIGFLFCCGFGFFMFGIPIITVISERKRKMQYLPPKIAIEGHGIKRGLTAVEAAILMQEPLDKVMTMVLFGVVKKGAAEVIKKEPLALKVNKPLPAGMHEYEGDFLAAFEFSKKSEQRKALQNMTVRLVKSVGEKMKGFSRKETVDYYKAIMERAWQQIEAAGTPEVKSQMFDEALEWTMLDKDYDDRTRRTFTGPVYVPMWWGRYDPSWGRTATGTSHGLPGIPSSSGSQGGLPGSSFAASIVGGVQSMASGVIGDINTFTSGVTNTTNPMPKASSSGGHRSGGGGCACACACAGCACACAGGGR